MSDGAPGIVVLGTPRSGTTLLRRLLDAHPRIACPGETNLLASCGRFLESERTVAGVEIGVVSGLAFAGVPEERVLESLRSMVLGFHREIARRAGKPRWAEKTAFDSFYLPTVERLMVGHAKFIVLNRHGLDFASSMDELCRENGTFLPEVHRYIREYPMPLEAYARCWADLTNGLLDFAERHPVDVLTIRYEDLVADPHSTMSRVFAFLGEECPDGLVEGALRSRSGIGLGDWKTYGKTTVDLTSVGRGGSIPDFAKHRLAAMLNPTLRRAGYGEIEATAEPTTEESRRAYEIGLLLGGMRKRPGGP